MELLNSLPWISIHVSSVLLTLAVVVIADFHGLLWVLGKKETLSLQRLQLFHWLTWLGLVVTIVSGAVMFAGMSDYLLSLWAFRFKLLFVVALVINAFLIGKHIHIASELPWKDVPREQKRALIISGLVSTISWAGAYIMAHFLG